MLILLFVEFSYYSILYSIILSSKNKSVFQKISHHFYPFLSVLVETGKESLLRLVPPNTYRSLRTAPPFRKTAKDREHFRSIAQKKGGIKPPLSLRRTHSFFVPSHAPARSLRRKAFIPRSPIPAACLFPSIALREGVRQATKQAATEPRRRRSKRRKTRRRPCLSETDARSKR